MGHVASREQAGDRRGRRARRWGASFRRRGSLGAVAGITAPGEGVSTRDLIERIASGELGARLRGEVAGWHPDVARVEVEDAFQQACLLAASRCHGRVEWEVYKWLRTTTHRELNRVRRRARFEVLAEPRAVERHAGSGSAVETEVVDREDRAELEEAARTVLERLSDRQRAIAVLYARGNRRAQIASYLGITPRTVKRQLERIMAAGRDELVCLAGPGCAAGEALVARFAFGLASPREEGLAQLHLAGCRRCGGLYERLDLWREKVAVLLPLPAAEQIQPGVAERALHGLADAFGAVRDHVSAGASSAREHLVGAGSQLKQHATASYYRATDPTPLAGVRPGATASVIAGCLALGGGATYCLDQGVGPLADLRGSAVRSDDKPAAPKVRKARAELPAPSVVAPPAAEPQPAPQETTTHAAPPAPPPPPAQPEEEFEPQEPAVASAASTPAASEASAPAPAPAPASGPGEFDGP